MTTIKPGIGRLALAFVFLLIASASAFAQYQVRKVPYEESLKTQGVVITRTPDSFTVLDINDVETVVVLTASTKVRTHKMGLFRGGTSYPATSILRGLRVQAEGVGNVEGELVAKLVKFTNLPISSFVLEVPRDTQRPRQTITDGTGR